MEKGYTVNEVIAYLQRASERWQQVAHDHPEEAYGAEGISRILADVRARLELGDSHERLLYLLNARDSHGKLLAWAKNNRFRLALREQVEADGIVKGPK